MPGQEEKQMKQEKPNLADVYVGFHLDPPTALFVNDTRFKFNVEMTIRAYVDAYYFMTEVQGDRNRALTLAKNGSSYIRWLLEMMIECEMISCEDAVTIYAICKYIGTDLNINERGEDEWI